MLLSRFRRPAPASGFSGARVAMPLLHQEGPSQVGSLPGGVPPRVGSLPGWDCPPGWGPSPGGVPPQVGLPPQVRSLPRWGPYPGGVSS